MLLFTSPGVKYEDKETNKLCVVFYGLARAVSIDYSLNDCLGKGPNLTPTFLTIVRFRSHPIRIVPHIEKAFHQIAVNASERDMFRFLWLENNGESLPKVNQYIFFRLMFGLTPSPAILNGVI